mmetsp:Transcript_41402/g.125059  ORF Transcript_41402/g.125059 Transcript_41402/m.125059 type:complete len:215 (+) Transcript_41402:223-867(+)
MGRRGRAAADARAPAPGAGARARAHRRARGGPGGQAPPVHGRLGIHVLCRLQLHRRRPSAPPRGQRRRNRVDGRSQAGREAGAADGREGDSAGKFHRDASQRRVDHGEVRGPEGRPRAEVVEVRGVHLHAGCPVREAHRFRRGGVLFQAGGDARRDVPDEGARAVDLRQRARPEGGQLLASLGVRPSGAHLERRVFEGGLQLGRESLRRREGGR